MIWRILAGIAGLGVVAAATHLNVMHAGGYQSGDAALIIAAAVLLAIGAGAAAAVWRDGDRFPALALALCVVAGECYWLAMNAERELAAREAIARPVAEAAAKRAAAEKRIEEAQTAKRQADAAAISEAAKPGCRVNCAALLESAKRSAETELAAARAALAGLPALPSVTPLADRIGVPAWLWDLVVAGLRSLLVIGGSIALALVHPVRRRVHAETPRLAPAPASSIAVEVVDLVEETGAANRKKNGPEPDQSADQFPDQSTDQFSSGKDQLAAKSSGQSPMGQAMVRPVPDQFPHQSVQIPAPKVRPPPEPTRAAADPLAGDDAKHHAGAWAKAHLVPARGGSVPQATAYAAYRAACQGREPLSENAFGRQLTTLGFRRKKNGVYRYLDVRLAAQGPGLRVVASNEHAAERLTAVAGTAVGRRGMPPIAS
jgi:hypothetical protein